MSEEPTKAVSPLRQRMIDDMRMRKLSDKTQIAYIRAVRRLARFLGRSPDTATAEDVRRFQLHLVDVGMSPISINATALREFGGSTRYAGSNGRPWGALAKDADVGGAAPDEGESGRSANAITPRNAASPAQTHAPLIKPLLIAWWQL